jgi:predicted AAA+ superfamily ATPase
MKYIKRNIEKEIKTLVKEFPIVALLGPRQSGKTTLSKYLFPKYKYVSLEDYDNRELAKNDPRAFFKKYPKKIIIDEIQRVPELFSYLQTHSDEINENGQFIITGSQNYLLMAKVTQSLAGRVGIATLLPFSINELEQKINLHDILFSGFYPRLHSQKIRPTSFYKSYIDTYLEKDVRQLANIEQYDIFKKFLLVLSGRTGQILNISSVAVECGISRITVNKWLNILETSYIIFRLPSFHKNYKKQVVKSSKIFFYDTGLVCNLLGIKSIDQLETHYLLGNIFETFVINEFLKISFNFGKNYNFYYWRDKKGKEIDLIFEKGIEKYGVEIKLGKTIKNDFFKNLRYWATLDKYNNSIMIYNGEMEVNMNNTEVFNWKNIKKIIK